MRIKIQYEDEALMVCHKPAGFAAQTAKLGEADLVSEIKNYLKTKEGREPYVGLVHRLDQPVEGLLVVAKTPKAAASLSKQLSSDKFEKYYSAVVCGQPEVTEESVCLVDYLKKDVRSNLSKISSKGEKDAKYAELSYCVRERRDNLAIVQILLKTGRHHQIRVQLSHAGYPLLGDQKYGTKESIAYASEKGIREVYLFADRLRFSHPDTGKQMEFAITPSNLKFV